MKCEDAEQEFVGEEGDWGRVGMDMSGGELVGNCCCCCRQGSAIVGRRRGQSGGGHEVGHGAYGHVPVGWVLQTAGNVSL